MAKKKEDALVEEKVEWLDDPLEVDTVSSYDEEVIAQERVLLQSKFPAKIRLTGLVTGEQYVWENAGSVVEVASEDVPNLLEKKVGRTACCGGTSRGNKLFLVVGG